MFHYFNLYRKMLETISNLYYSIKLIFIGEDYNEFRCIICCHGLKLCLNKLLANYLSHSKHLLYVFQAKMHASVQDLGKNHHQMMLFLQNHHL